MWRDATFLHVVMMMIFLPLTFLFSSHLLLSSKSNQLPHFYSSTPRTLCFRVLFFMRNFWCTLEQKVEIVEKLFSSPCKKRYLHWLRGCLCYVQYRYCEMMMMINMLNCCCFGMECRVLFGVLLFCMFLLLNYFFIKLIHTHLML